MEKGGNGCGILRGMEDLLYKRVVSVGASTPGKGQGRAPHEQVFRRDLAQAAEGAASVWRVERQRAVNGRSLRPALHCDVMQLIREVLVK